MNIPTQANTGLEWGTGRGRRRRKGQRFFPNCHHEERSFCATKDLWIRLECPNAKVLRWESSAQRTTPLPQDDKVKVGRTELGSRFRSITK